MIADIRNNPSYYEKDPKKKNSNWANTIITMLRSNWSNIVDKERSKRGMNILMSTQSLDSVKSSFKDGTAFKDSLTKNNKWIQIAVWDRIRHILIAEYKKALYKPRVDAADPAASADRKRDKAILKNRDLIIKPTNELNARIGNPPYQIPKDQYSGNVELFDELGLDSNDATDVTFFFNVFHRLNYEISAQELLWALLDYNEFDKEIENLVNDILAKMAASFQCYTDVNSGEIKWKYIDPAKIKSIRGERNDFKDAMCMGYEKTVSVRQFLEFAGSDFNFERDRGMLWMALQTSGIGLDWTSLTYQGGIDDQGEVCYPWGNVLQANVSIGYIEWKSVEGVAGKRHKQTKLFYNIDYNTEISPNSSYTKETTEFQKTYKAWYLSTGNYSQHIFNYGPLYHQLTSGAYDEYSSYSLYAIVIPGLSPVEISEPFIDIANKAFYKMLWGIDQSTPRKRVYNYEAIVQLAGKIQSANTSNGLQPNTSGGANNIEKQNVGVAGRVDELVSNMVGNLYELYTIPEIDGQKMGGNQRPHYWDEGGIDPVAVGMQTVLDWAEAQVSNRLGFNGLRDANTPDPKDGLGVNMEALKQSRNATHFIPDTLSYVIKNVSISSMMRAQDGIEFPGTPIYEFIKRLIGQDAIEDFKALKKIPAHRYAIFVNVMSAENEKKEFKDEAREAYVKGLISYDQYFVVLEYEDMKKARKIMSFYQYKNERKKEKDAELMHKRAMELEQAKTQGQITIDANKGQWAVEEKNVWGEWYMRANQTPADAKLQSKAMDQENNARKLNEKADVDIKVERARAEIKNQESANSLI